MITRFRRLYNVVDGFFDRPTLSEEICFSQETGFAAKLTASDGAANNFFGFSMAANGETVVIGAQGHDGNRGSAYVFGSHTVLYLPLILR